MSSQSSFCLFPRWFLSRPKHSTHVSEHFSYGSSSSGTFRLIILLLPLFGVIYLPALTGCWGMSSLFLHGNFVLIRKAATNREIFHKVLVSPSSMWFFPKIAMKSLFRCSGHTQHCNLLCAEQTTPLECGNGAGRKNKEGESMLVLLLSPLSWAAQGWGY